MKAYDFVKSSIGSKCIITGDGDLAFYAELKPLILDKVVLTIVKLTRAGMAYLKSNDGKYYSVPPRNVREFIAG